MLFPILATIWFVICKYDELPWAFEVIIISSCKEQNVFGLKFKPFVSGFLCARNCYFFLSRKCILFYLIKWKNYNWQPQGSYKVFRHLKVNIQTVIPENKVSTYFGKDSFWHAKRDLCLQTLPFQLQYDILHFKRIPDIIFKGRSITTNLVWYCRFLKYSEHKGIT